MENLEKHLCTVQDEVLAGMLGEMLEQEHIAYLIRHKGVGVIYNSAFAFGVDIYVTPSDYDRAKELVDAFFSQPLEIDPDELI